MKRNLPEKFNSKKEPQPRRCCNFNRYILFIICSIYASCRQYNTSINCVYGPFCFSPSLPTTLCSCTFLFHAPLSLKPYLATIHRHTHTHTRRAMAGHSICMILCTIVYFCHFLFRLLPVVAFLLLLDDNFLSLGGCCIILSAFWLREKGVYFFSYFYAIENNMNKSALQI